MPADIPVTTPALLMVAILVLLLDHVPPAVLSDNVVVEPVQMVVVPLMDDAGLLTVTVVVLLPVPQLPVTV